MSHHTRRRIHHLLRELERQATRATVHAEDFMADITELNAKIAELNQAVADDEAQDDANDAALQAVITDLRAQLAAAQAGTPTDFTAQIQALEDIRGKLHLPSAG